MMHGEARGNRSYHTTSISHKTTNTPIPAVSLKHLSTEVRETTAQGSSLRRTCGWRSRPLLCVNSKVWSPGTQGPVIVGSHSRFPQSRRGTTFDTHCTRETESCLDLTRSNQLARCAKDDESLQVSVLSPRRPHSRMPATSAVRDSTSLWRYQIYL